MPLKMFLKKRGIFENAPPGWWRRHGFFVLLVLVVFGADQASKFWVIDAFSNGFEGLEGVSAKVKKFLRDETKPGPGGYHYRPKASVEISQNHLRFHYAENTGAAFSLFATWPEKTRRWFFNMVSIIAVGVLLYLYLKLPKVASRKELWIRMGLPLVLGGALGNHVDRLARGFVVDFIQAHWQNRWFWPSFNVADMAICIGMACLILDAFVRKETKGRL
ncbi:MAG: signal peptidase II [Cystobacterineae bacterium]|nr:signal peptidase II [Cystobacterineae bacterium]